MERVEYQSAVPCETEWVDDSSMYQGESRVLTAGVDGVANVTANVTRLDGTETGRDVLSSVTVTEPVTRVVAVAPKSGPRPWLPVPSPGPPADG